MTTAERAALDRDTDDGGILRCRRCGRAVRTAEGRALCQYSKHHRKKRRHPDADLVENIVILCGSGVTGCHGMCHSSAHQTRMHDDGWVCWSWETPAEQHCVTTYGTVIVFTEDGQLVEDRMGPLPDEDPFDPSYGVRPPL